MKESQNIECLSFRANIWPLWSYKDKKENIRTFHWKGMAKQIKELVSDLVVK